MPSNVNLIEIKKFSALAQKWWDTEGPMKILHVINDLRLPFILSAGSIQNLKVLDVGCGAGILTESMAKQNAKVTGIDLAKTSLEIATQHAQKNHLSIDYQLCSTEDFVKSHAGEFDVITCMEMLEHVPNPNIIIKACSKLVKKNGSVFYSTINRTFKAYLFSIVIGEYILHMLPKGTHHYSMLIKPTELIQWNTAQGLKYKKSASFIYNPLNKKFKLKNKLDVNYIMQFIKNT